ncbi:MAG: acyl-CoA reductase [Cyclobacteriaceae bacterium]|nr:acyl-CoA reductase [Cyclobacteriaceae bacterium]
MTLEQRISVLARLGTYLNKLQPEEFINLAEKAAIENPWFTPDNVERAIKGVSQYLDYNKLLDWTRPYRFNNRSPRTIALVMAGNIPLVGFHDLLCVLISGNRALAKYSSKDSQLIKFIVNKLIELEPGFSEMVVLTDGQLKSFDAVIATGSDNSARYFLQYFGKYPHIIRKNRVSVSVLDGQETDADLTLLGEDIFSYFGLGCRNVAKIFVPADFDLERLHRAWKKFEPIIHHHKYANNYDYQKSILLVNRHPFTDFGFVLLKESELLASPVSVVYFQRYKNLRDVHAELERSASKIQCIVSRVVPNAVPFGQAQYPELWDYADGIDTLRFIESLGT